MSKRLHFENLPKIPIKLKKKNPLNQNLDDRTTSRFFETLNDYQESDVLNLNKNSKELEPTANKVWYPTNWKQHLCNIRIMRENFTAPVDTMGCDQCADSSASSTIFRFQTLVSLMLSSQTKDQLTYEVMQRLKEVDCSPESIVSLSDEGLGKLIYPVSFWKRKVQYLKKTSKIIIEKFNGDIPKNVKDLCSLPGVGPKMAHICMQIAWKEISGIGVDTHVHRISNRLKWVPAPTKTPEETRNVLEKWLPRELWGEINHLFVGFGQVICHSQRPKCSDCMNRNICPFAKSIYQF
ncbi:endonuclease III-like protein 1 isoform X1 [Nasonia vitripennis]|uniref:Endonuclease III homolog n=1 Tax=Nasonia vitripennis TaxID=7425 RepID=A0A7M7QI80_NASVI|nr:endonuclease III-like protein 1 isoform X1 [Nasonia vitripennis]